MLVEINAGLGMGVWNGNYNILPKEIQRAKEELFDNAAQNGVVRI